MSDNFSWLDDADDFQKQGVGGRMRISSCQLAG